MLKFFEGYNEVINVKTNHKICKVFDWSHEWKKRKDGVGTTIKPKNRNLQPKGQGRGVEKSHVFDTFPLVTRNMSKIKKKGTLERTPSLEEPSLAITTCFEIDATCTCCNTIDTLYL